MIRPEPITIDGRSGVIVFLDTDREPVEPSDPTAVMAKAIFDDGGRAFYTVTPTTRHDLGGAGSGNFGHSGRVGEIGGSGPSQGSHGTKPSVKGKNILDFVDEADDAVVSNVLHLDSEAAVRDVAEAMVQYVDQEQFTVVIGTEGGGPSDEDLEDRYNVWVDEQRLDAEHEWVTDRVDRQAEVQALWEQVLEERRSGPYGDTRDIPTLPLPDEETPFTPLETSGERIRISDLLEGVDQSAEFSEDERQTVLDRLRATPGGPLLESRNAMREEWNSTIGREFEPNDSFSDWAEGRGHHIGSGEDEVVTMKFTGDKGTVMTREFKRNEEGELVAVHDFFKTQHQGGGVAKDVLRGSFDEYATLGVDKVEVHANINVGGYAWAKFGFTLTEDSQREVEREVDSWIGDAASSGQITTEERQTLEDIATDHAGERTLLWHIADATHDGKKIGAKVLLEQDWYGEIRLDDRRAMDRLRSYIGETKPTAARPAPAPDRASENIAAERAAARRGEEDPGAWDKAHAPKVDKGAERIAYVPQAWDKAREEDAARTVVEENRQRIAKAMRPVTTTPSDSTESKLAAARRHFEEIQSGFNTLYGQRTRSAKEQRAALVSQERATVARIRKLEKQMKLADDPPQKPSRALFYEKADGTVDDADLWQDLLGEDYPDETPPAPSGTETRMDSTRRDLGGSGSGNFGHKGRPGEIGGSSGEGGDGTGATSGGGTQSVDAPPGLDPRPAPIDHSATPPAPDPPLPPLGTKVEPILAKNLDEAVDLILQGKVVELQDVTTVHTVLTKLAEVANDAKAKGEKAPKYDLCNVSVAGTNLFCGDALKTEKHPNGIKRIEMPQLKAEALPDTPAAKLPRDADGNVNASDAFVAHLEAGGVPVAKEERVPASLLKATQIQLVGKTVAGMMTDPTYKPDDEAIFISSDNYVLDGHHRWAAQVGRDAADGKLGDSTMKVRRIKATMSELIYRAADFTKAYGLKPKPGATSLSALAMIFNNEMTTTLPYREKLAALLQTWTTSKT